MNYKVKVELRVRRLIASWGLPQTYSLRSMIGCSLSCRPILTDTSLTVFLPCVTSPTGSFLRTERVCHVFTTSFSPWIVVTTWANYTSSGLTIQLPPKRTNAGGNSPAGVLFP